MLKYFSTGKTSDQLNKIYLKFNEQFWQNFVISDWKTMRSCNDFENYWLNLLIDYNFGQLVHCRTQIGSKKQLNYALLKNYS